MDVLSFGLTVLLACAKLIFVYGLITVGVVLGGIHAVIVFLFSIVIFLFETWVFQAVFGAWIVFALQRLHHVSTQKADRLQRRYDQKSAAIHAFFGLVDKRIYATRAYRDALVSKDRHETWIAERERYRPIVREWNERAPGIIVTMLTLLPKRFCYSLERETFRRFAEMDAYLRRVRHAREEEQFDSVSAALVAGMLTELSDFSKVSLADFLNLAREEARLIDRKPTISPENEPNLSLGYLITSLFKPAIN